MAGSKGRSKKRAAKRKPEISPPACAECGRDANLVKGDIIYPHRPDLYELNFWKCMCGAYVGCHKGGPGIKPLSRPALSYLRKARGYVHSVLDPIWQRADELPLYDPESEEARIKIRKAARNRVYQWLAEQMEITREQCRTGEFDLEQCRTAYRLLRATDYEQIRLHLKKAES